MNLSRIVCANGAGEPSLALRVNALSFAEWQSADRLARNAIDPTLIVPDGMPRPQGDPRFQNILCPVDFSPGSVLACSHALSLAQRAAGSLTLLHALDEVCHLDEVHVSWGARDRQDPVRTRPPANRLLLMAEARARLGMAISRETLERCQAGLQIAIGAADVQTTAAALRLGADLIVIGLTSRTGAKPPRGDFMVGQVAAQASCPVLVLCAPAGSRAWDAEFDVPGGRHGDMDLERPGIQFVVNR